MSVSQDKVEGGIKVGRVEQPDMVFGGHDRPQPCTHSRLPKNAVGVNIRLEQQQQPASLRPSCKTSRRSMRSREEPQTSNKRSR